MWAAFRYSFSASSLRSRTSWNPYLQKPFTYSSAMPYLVLRHTTWVRNGGMTGGGNVDTLPLASAPRKRERNTRGRERERGGGRERERPAEEALALCLRHSLHCFHEGQLCFLSLGFVAGSLQCAPSSASAAPALTLCSLASPYTSARKTWYLHM